ncbi:MAG: insulinase family protein [Prevotella sp.]|nr:insulinase family protein [Prevotella sp.]
MKTKILLAIGALLALGMSSCSKYKYETVKGDLAQTRIYTLDNGLKVYLSVNKEEPRIQTYIAVRTGSKNDPAETTGLAHYLEHLMFKGTKQFGTNDSEAEAPLLDEIEKRYEAYRKLTDPDARKQAYHEIDSLSQLAAKYNIPNEYDKLMAAIGAEGTNAYTSFDVTCYTENIPANEVDNWAKIQADRFKNMVIRGFHTELEAVYEEYNIGLSNDMTKLYYTMAKMLFPNHPYGLQTVIGTQDHLKNPSITNIKNYFKKWYVPNNVAICMSGDLDPDKTMAIIEQYFGDWKPGDDVSQPVFDPLTELSQPKDTAVIGQEAEQVWVGWRALQANTQQADTLQLMENVLSNGRAGLFDLDLNQTMKVQRAFATPELMHDHGCFILMGTPKEGQTLEEVRSLMLAEIDKLKKGDFPDNLLTSIINNMKRNHYELLERNDGRADMFVDAFINEIDWQQEVGRIDRISKITKQEVIDFANRFFTEGYVTVFKKQGIDPNQKKIEKPAITPIQANRDQVSDFVKQIQEAKVEPIQPKFVDYQKDMTIGKTGYDQPLYYVKNKTNGLFELVFQYDFGQSADRRYDVVSDYFKYLGTDKLSAADLRQKFYELACDISVSVAAENINVTLSGLSENMEPALALMQDVLQNVKVDKDAYNEMVGVTLKARNDVKKDQRNYFEFLYRYATQGEHNAYRDMVPEQELKETDPQVFVDLLKALGQYQHKVLYYGPLDEGKVSESVSKLFAKDLKPVPENQPYLDQLANQNEILIAPYDAKNIYMRMYHNEGRDWNPDESAVRALFNEYFGGGMNGIVFQEMRETRGLAYNAYARYNRPTVKGRKESFMTHIITQNDKMMDAVNHFNEIMNQMPASENAFQIAKDALTKQLASERINKMGIIWNYIAAKKLGIDYDLNAKIYEQLPQVTLQNVVDFAKQQIADKPYRYIILGDEKELDMKSLEKIGPIKRLKTEEVFGY